MAKNEKLTVDNLEAELLATFARICLLQNEVEDYCKGKFCGVAKCKHCKEPIDICDCESPIWREGK